MVTRALSDGRQDSPDGPKIHAAAPALRILVVEDDVDTADCMAIMLGLWGFKPLIARSGTEALQAVQAGCPDLVLLDIGLPGMNGLEVAKRLREQLPPNGKTPFLIAVTGYGDAQICRRSLEAGIDLHLIKPVDPTALEQLLKRYQGTIMPAAERKLSRSHRRVRLIPTLKHCSERAILKQCLVTATEIRGKGEVVRTKLRAAPGRQERSELREEWCKHATRFLDEAAKVSCLLASFQRCGIYS